jgi:hypothetical protein
MCEPKHNHTQSNPIMDRTRWRARDYDGDVTIEWAGPLKPLTSAIAQSGFTFVRAGEMRELLMRAGSLVDWPAFAASWDNLELDGYMADGGRYRRRRHAVYAAMADGPIVREPHQPHYQSRDYNTLNGGIARWFEPVDTAIGSGATMSAILAFSRALFESVAGPRNWHIETHQFRIEARQDERGQPTPEGVHRDGVDYVLVLLIGRRNIRSGTTTVHRVNPTPGDKGPRSEADEIGRFTLTDPLDAALLDDSRVAHGVTPIEPVDVERPACRDVLVVTWQHTG